MSASEPDNVIPVFLSSGVAGYAGVKRSLDLALVLMGLALVLPVLALVALAVALDSPGPLLFRQTRIGKDGVPFEIYKFRTMRVLENGPEIVQAIKGDARVTRTGRILRSLSLDELPQLFNVLRGEMSLVGPRPHAAAHDDYYCALLPGYALRRQVRPGITGWAQVNGLRGPTPDIAMMRDRMAHDLWYIRHASLWLDLKILALTPRKVLGRRNAH